MIVTVHAKPHARTNSIAWLDDTPAKVTVTAAPESGKATIAIADLLAEHYGIAKSRVTLVRGATTRMKQFSVEI